MFRVCAGSDIPMSEHCFRSWLQRIGLRPGFGGTPPRLNSCQHLQCLQDWGFRARQSKGNVDQPGWIATSAKPLAQRVAGQLVSDVAAEPEGVSDRTLRCVDADLLIRPRNDDLVASDLECGPIEVMPRNSTRADGRP